MSLNRGAVLQVHICTTGDEAIVQGLTLKRKEHNIVCKEVRKNLQKHEMQFVN